MFEKRMRNHYRTAKDITDRLNNTVVLFDGVPHILSTSGTSILGYLLKDYPNSKSIKIDPEDPRLDISSIELGYFNIEPNCPLNGVKKGVCAYLERTPQRQYSQSVNPNKLRVVSPIVGRNTYSPSFLGHPMVKMIQDEYPTATEAVWNLSAGTHESIAISRDVALVAEGSGMMSVALNRENIGTLIPSENRVLVKDHEFIWVVEKLLSRFNIKVDPFKGLGVNHEGL